MAETKQATAETVCEHCGKTKVQHPGMNVEGRYVAFCDSNEYTVFTPRTQPSRKEPKPEDVSIFHSENDYHEYRECYVPAIGSGCGTCYERGVGLMGRSYTLHLHIPDDLKSKYEFYSQLHSTQSMLIVYLIERIARLEGDR